MAQGGAHGNVPWNRVGTMIERLQEAFRQAGQLPEQEQQVLAELLIEEMKASAKWDTLFADPRSERLIERLVNEALAEDAAGKTEDITGDDFQS